MPKGLSVQEKMAKMKADLEKKRQMAEQVQNETDEKSINPDKNEEIEIKDKDKPPQEDQLESQNEEKTEQIIEPQKPEKKLQEQPEKKQQPKKSAAQTQKRKIKSSNSKKESSAASGSTEVTSKKRRKKAGIQFDLPWDESMDYDEFIYKNFKRGLRLNNINKTTLTRALMKVAPDIFDENLLEQIGERILYDFDPEQTVDELSKIIANYLKQKA